MLLKKQLFKRPKAKDEEKPLSERGLSQRVYKILNALLPVVLLILIRVGLVELSVIVALFSKWRVFTVKPRHMWANLRSNGVDIIVKLSTLSFMIQAQDAIVQQLLWTAWYIFWLVKIKPGSTIGYVSAQAMLGQVLGLSALMYYSNDLNDVILLFAAWVIGLVSARHFLSSYEEKKASIIASIWGLFTVQMTWILNKWTLVYVFIPQLVFIVMIVSYTLASIYDHYKKDKLKPAFMQQQVVIAVLVLIAIIIIGDWRGEI